MSLEIGELEAMRRFCPEGLEPYRFNPRTAMRKLVEEGLDLAARHKAITTGVLIGAGVGLIVGLVLVTLSIGNKSPEFANPHDYQINLLDELFKRVVPKHVVATPLVSVLLGGAIGGTIARFWKPGEI